MTGILSSCLCHFTVVVFYLRASPYTTLTLVSGHKFLEDLVVICHGHLPASDSNFQIIFRYSNMQD